jgi:CPA2 family monovalent cation:H+ antiporter-2
MDHPPSLIATIAAGFTAAWALGLLTQKMRLSPIVGYLLAGVVIGPYSPGFVGDPEMAHQLAELGVILMMFGVGMHFHVDDLLRVKGVAIPGAIGQSLVATIAGIVIFTALGMPLKTGAVLGMAMAVASTVVLMRVLMDANVLNSPQGHIAVGWLIVEDILTVVLLVLIPALGTDSNVDPEHAVAATPLWIALGMAFIKLGALVAVVMIGGARFVPWVLVRVARLRSSELFTLTVLVLSIAIAAGSYYIFGVSMALGAFLAGMVVAQSPVAHQAGADVLPLRDAFSVLFFVAVGMLFNPHFVLEQPLLIVAALGIILIAKPLAALAIVAFLGHPSRTAITVALGLAQIGEFSFILADLGKKYGMVTADGYNVLVASAIFSITVNPLIFRYIPQIEHWLIRHPRLWNLLNARAERKGLLANFESVTRLKAYSDDKPNMAVVIGYGPVGRTVDRTLQESGIMTVVVDLNMETIQTLVGSGRVAVFGNASNKAILEQAGAKRATHIIVTLPEAGARAAVVTAARDLNPDARILVRARYLQERAILEQSGASAAVFEEGEAALALARLVLADTGVHRQAAEHKLNDLRMQLIMENVASIHTQKVRSVMVPWSNVRWLSRSMSHTAVMKQVAEERFSRWPVIDPRTGQAIGYLLTRDLISRAEEADWLSLVRPLTAVSADETVNDVLSRMQADGVSIYAVESNGQLVGLITREDILEQVVGQIEDEYPREAEIRVADALERGGVQLELAAHTFDVAIQELVSIVPPYSLPSGTSADEVVQLVLEREAEHSTNLGDGVGVPHARISGLQHPIVVFGRSHEGVLFGDDTDVEVHLIFLLLTPLDRPELQLALLSQISRACGTPTQRDTLMRASSAMEVLENLDLHATTL